MENKGKQHEYDPHQHVMLPNKQVIVYPLYLLSIIYQNTTETKDGK